MFDGEGSVSGKLKIIKRQQFRRTISTLFLEKKDYNCSSYFLYLITLFTSYLMENVLQVDYLYFLC